MDRKGIAAYIAIVIIVSFAIEALIIGMGLTLWPAYLLLLVPAAAARAASRLSPSVSYFTGAAWRVPIRPALRMTVAIPMVFAVAYAISSVIGYVRFDWDFGELMGLLAPLEQLKIDPQLALLIPKIAFIMALLLSVILGPTAYALLMLGNEYGWRGYLLPRLMPLGRWRAYIITGVLWGLSILPLVLATPGGPPVVDTVRLLAMMVALSLLLGKVWNRSRNLGLTAVCCGCCICQATTIWTFSVVSPTTLLPWAAGFDNTAIAAVLITAFGATRLFGKLDGAAREARNTPLDGRSIDG